eukprot:8270844-Ditylum_brightwellii.AAC.1
MSRRSRREEIDKNEPVVRNLIVQCENLELEEPDPMAITADQIAAIVAAVDAAINVAGTEVKTNCMI